MSSSPFSVKLLSRAGSHPKQPGRAEDNCPPIYRWVAGAFPVSPIRDDRPYHRGRVRGQSCPPIQKPTHSQSPICATCGKREAWNCFYGFLQFFAVFCATSYCGVSAQSGGRHHPALSFTLTPYPQTSRPSASSSHRWRHLPGA